MTRLLAWMLLAGVASAATVRVQISGRVVELDLEEYVAATLAGESSVFQSEEALKAMAVAARTYAVRFAGRHADEGFDLCDKTHCQGVDVKAVTARLKTAAGKTAGEVLLYQGKPALSYYTRDCGGRSEDVHSVWPEESAPYLSSHADPYCLRNGGLRWHWETESKELLAALTRSGLRAPPAIERISIVQRAPSGRALTLSLFGGGQTDRISASSLRFAVGRALGFNTIQSDKYDVGQAGGRLIFDGSGSGHGVGLCQNGAEQMGREGHSYREILAFYYQGTSVQGQSVKLDWRQLSGERVTVFTTQPDRDGALLQGAERQLRAAEERVRLNAPSTVELRVYPDVDSFRDATGEPGWVAARVSGRRIQLQPLSVLRGRGVLESTLEHEFLHAVIEENAKPGLPVWFREGLVAYLAHSASAAGSEAVHDGDLRQTADQGRARDAYENARRQVAGLVQRYTEPVVLGWLKLGLPREVTNANSKQVPTKSK